MQMDRREYPPWWNAAGLTREPEARFHSPGPVEFHDETLRDGIQGPSVTDPPLEAKIEMLEMLESLGVQSVDLGLPGAGPRAFADVTALARYMAARCMKISPQCAARTHVADIDAIIEICQSTGLAIEVATFVGASPIRQFVEEWSLDRLRRLSAAAIDRARTAGLPVSFVTEDTTRSHPDTLTVLYREAVERGARRVAICDTVGVATPAGARAIVRFIRRVVDGADVAVGVDWHGHNDRGLALINAIAAASAGANRLHGTALGIGERVGNTALDQLLAYYRQEGLVDNDLTRLGDWCRLVSDACMWPIPRGYPTLHGRVAPGTARQEAPPSNQEIRP